MTQYITFALRPSSSSSSIGHSRNANNHASGSLAILVFAVVLVLARPGVAQQRQTDPALAAIGDQSLLAHVADEELIEFCLYTCQQGVLKLSAHLHPLSEPDSFRVNLEVRVGDDWRPVAEAAVHPVGWTAVFRIRNWDMDRSLPYRVRHAGGSVFEGVIRRNPVEKDTIVAALFTGNSTGPGGGRISKRDIVNNIRALDPDVLLFTGDQVYQHRQHTRSWLAFGREFRDIMRDRPTICLPDDHDVGQGNLWGGGGRKTNLDVKGGYTRPADYVKLVQRQQTSHLPDAYDPTPVRQGIGVYYTSLNIGGVDFAIIEDRKFKSGCYGLVTRAMGSRPEHIDKPNFDPALFDLPNRTLLGERQMKFLERWGQQWDHVTFKAVVSQTLWSMVSTYHSSHEQMCYADFDSNGWPQTPRSRAIATVRRCFAVHLCGDQHLATLVQYGIDDWRDSNWAFCVPAIANPWPRGWLPSQPGKNAEPGAQEYTGDFLDGFGNKVTVFAHTNPRPTGRKPAILHDRMPGFGIVRFDKPRREITFECWPRMVDLTDVDNVKKQYTGWPRTIHMYDNFGRRPVAWLPRLIIDGMSDPRVQVVDEETKSIVYTLRIQGQQWTPKVFHAGSYTIKVGPEGRQKVFRGVQSHGQPDKETLHVAF